MFLQAAVTPSYPSYGVPQRSVLGSILFVLYTQPLSQILFSHSCPHQFFVDETRLPKSYSPEHYDGTTNALQTCISDMKDWLTGNKLQLKADKTETMLLNSSKLSIHRTSFDLPNHHFFSDSVRNLGFYLDKDLSIKERINLPAKLLP